MKVFELAKELTVQSKEIVSLLKENGEENITHMTLLTNEQIDFIKSEFSTASKVEEERLAKEAKAKAEAETAIKERERIEKQSDPKTDTDYRPDEMIPCRSVFPGVLLFTGTHTGMTYTFTGMGDRRNIEYQDLKAGLLEQRSSMFNPDFIIEDNNLINDEHWYELKQVYEGMYDEKDIKRVMELPSRDFEAAFVQLPVTARNTIITMIATQIENGTFEQYNKAKIIDKVCGTRFDLKM